jgi:hypothetical protein
MARLRFEESLAIWNESGDKEGMGEVIACLARVEAHEGNRTVARALYEQSLALTSDNNHSEIATCLEGLAGVVASQGELAWAGHLSYKYRFFNGGCGNVPALDVFVFCDDPSPFAFSSSSQLKGEAVSGAQ